MKIIGRREERRKLDVILRSEKPEFVVVHGRRRVGKTYLVGEHFNGRFAFRASGLARGSYAEQLAAFGERLREHGSSHVESPASWIEAFSWLRELLAAEDVLRHAETGRRVVFIDEMPWFDTPRSGFKTALEYFWNGWACTQADIVLIACGSSTSWLANNLLEDAGGFYNRVTRVIDLQPFTLAECGEYFEWRNTGYSVRQVVESYMVFGGVPYYLGLQERGSSLAQNIDALLFKRGGQLIPEFDRLYSTLFRHPEPYVDIVKALARKRSGMTRTEISATLNMEGRALTKALRDLDQCGFTRNYRNFTKRKNGGMHQIVDPFTLFHLTFVENKRFDSWMGFVGTPAYHAWAGLSFEMVCLIHVDEIKDSLGISGVQTSACSWRSEAVEPGAQVDLLIDRRDGIINLCEMKYSEGEYAMSAAEERAIRNRLVAFRTETGTKKAVHPTLVTLEGAKRNAHYSSVVLNEVRVADWLD